jgi:hypothetical protein
MANINNKHSNIIENNSELDNNSDSSDSDDEHEIHNINKTNEEVNREINDCIEAVKGNRVKKVNCFQ